jgi:hypothetical protein
MKIDLVLTACNNNEEYLKMYPYIFKIWKSRFNLLCYLILIMNDIPKYLEDYKDYIILFPPIEKINTIFIAQNIRILYPAIFKNKNVLITDIDIAPVSKEYFINSVENYDIDTFISYTDRYISQNMLAICYNIANSEVWKKIFNIENSNDIINMLKSWYNEKYSGEKNSEGWFTDQQKLFEYVTKYQQNNNNKVIILKDKDIVYKRLDKRTKDIIKIIKNKNELYKNLDYTDVHLSKRIWKPGSYHNIMINILNKLSN